MNMTVEDVRAGVAIAALRVKYREPVAPRRPLFAHQQPPVEPFDVWLLLGGRGSGKTEAGARYVNAHAEGPACLEGPVPHRIAIVAPSHDDAVDTCVRGETGLLQVNPRIRFRPGAALQADLTWPSGGEAELFGTFAPEDVERFRGPQHCLIWGDEFAAWRKLDESWDMLQFGLRLGPAPHAILTTTPKRRPLLQRLIATPGTIVKNAKTSDNPSLPEARRIALYTRYGGTTLGRQELDAEILDDVEGALWTRALIRYVDPPRILRGTDIALHMSRIVVAIDPAATSGEDADETGIVVAGMAETTGQGHVLADLSGRKTPLEWAHDAVTAYRQFGADRIVAEANQGGEMVSTVIRTIDQSVPVTLVHASRGKRTRAEPVAALYEQRRVSHVEPFPDLEDQMCSYTGQPNEQSPDRMDALVWAMTNLMLEMSWQGASDVAVA